MPDHHTARHLASRLAALARALAVRALMGSLVPDHLVLGLRAQPLLDLVNAPLRAALGLAAPGASGVPAGMQAGASRFVSAEPVNRLQGSANRCRPTCQHAPRDSAAPAC